MLWFFDRGNEHMRIETTHDASNGTFTLTVYRADGTQETEMFWDLPAFEQRIQALEQQLALERWTAKGSRLLPKHGPEQPN